MNNLYSSPYGQRSFAAQCWEQVALVFGKELTPWKLFIVARQMLPKIKGFVKVCRR